MISFNGKWIYDIIRNPFLQVVKMPLENTCKGCTMLEFPYDKLEHDFRPYCALFDVWNDYNGHHDDLGSTIFPNEICKIHIREVNRSGLIFSQLNSLAVHLPSIKKL